MVFTFQFFLVTQLTSKKYLTYLARATKDYSGLEKFQAQQVKYEIQGKNPFRPRAKFRNAEKFIDRHQWVHKLANITIPAKCSAYIRRLSCGFPLHFVLCLELFCSSKHLVNSWRATVVYVYFVQENTKRLVVLLLCDWAEKNKDFLAPIRSQDCSDGLELVR